MLTATITNTSTMTIQPASAAYAAGVYPIPAFLTLPGCLSWITLAPTASATPIVSVADLEVSATTGGFGSLRVKDVLQQMIQAGWITVSYANLAIDVETYGKAIANET